MNLHRTRTHHTERAPSPAADRITKPAALAVMTMVAAAVTGWQGGFGTGSAGRSLIAPAHAQSRMPSATCAPGGGRLGVSRVVEIDTSGGPRFGQLQYHDNNFLHDGEVVLTFDDGPLRRHSRLVLEALAAHCTQATFYMVGQMAVADPEMAREIADAGHTIAIHTWSHKNLKSAGSAKATQEIELGISAVSRALGRPVAPFFRFPYLADTQPMLGLLSQRNFGVFSIDVDSRDFRTKDPRVMQRTLFDGLTARKKGILLFHDIQFSTAHGIRSVLDELSRRGFKVVHIIPKGEAKTQPNYDAMADAELARRKQVAAAQPLANRAVVWPMTPPGVPIETYNPQTAHAGPAVRTPFPPATVIRPAVGGGARPPATPATVQPPPASAPAPQSAPAQLTPASPAEKPPLRGTANEDDWRQRIFGN